MATTTANIDLRVQITNKQILKITLPIAASVLVPQMNFITNNIFLSGLGVQPLAVAGITGVFYLIFSVMGFGLSNGLQVLIARRAGENKVSEISNLFNQGIRIALIFALFGICIVYFFAPAIFKMSLINNSDAQLAINFLFIRIWGLPLLYMFQIRNALLVGINQSRYLIIGTFIETVTNIFFDYSLIYGHFGFPQMGFNGAAVASIVAELVGLITVFIVLRWKNISKQFQLAGNLAYNSFNTKLILTQSSPLILQSFISITSWEFFYILIEHHGERDLAISNIMRSVFGVFGCISWAFAATTNTMVSNVIGQNLHHRVTELILKIMKLSAGFAIIIFILLNIAPDFLLRMYNQNNDFINAAVPVVRIVSAALVLMSASVVWLNAVTGTGNTRINLLIELFAITLYCIYAYVVLQKLFLPITFGWAAEWLYWILVFIPSFFYMQSGKWKVKKL